MTPRPGHPQRPIPPDSPGAALAEYLRSLRSAANVTYRQMAATVPCRHNTLSQTVDGRRTGWPPVETFLKALRAAAAPGAVPDDAEARARLLWEQSRRQVPDRIRRPRGPSDGNGAAVPPGTGPSADTGPTSTLAGLQVPIPAAATAPAQDAPPAGPVPPVPAVPVQPGPTSPAPAIPVQSGPTGPVPPAPAIPVQSGPTGPVPPAPAVPVHPGAASPVPPASGGEPAAAVDADDEETATDSSGRLRRLLRVLRRR